MEGISRKNLDRICELLGNHIGTDESIQLANKLDKIDIIPKLYAYTYFKKVHDMIDELYEGKKIDVDELEQMIENNPKLELGGIVYGSNSVLIAKRMLGFLGNGFKREKMFCDFDDSRFHAAVSVGKCDNEDHDGDTTTNENLRLTPLYDADEDSAKYDDTPSSWWCKECIENTDFNDCDVTVSCDMDDDY